MENEIEEEGGVTLGYIFRTIFSQKWLALIIAAVITLAGTLGLYFIGKQDENYSVSFVSNLPGSQSSASYFEFPDGQTQHFTEMVSYDNLEKVKASSDAYSGIDIKKMYEEGDISVKCEIVEIVEDSKEYSATYYLTAKSKYFKSETVARDFLRDISSYSNRYLQSMVIDYTTALDASLETIMYDKQLDTLQEQISFINSEYAALINAYGGNFVVKDGRTLNYYKSQLQAFVDLGEISRLKIKAVEESYIKIDKNGEKDERAIAKYEAERYNKNREKEIQQKALDDAMVKLSNPSGSEQESGSVSGINGIVVVDPQAILNLTSSIARLEKELTEIDSFIHNGKISKEFDAQVTEVYNRVKDFTNEFAGISSTVYTTRSTVNYLNTNVITVSGGRGILMSLIVSLVVGIVLAAIVAYIVGWSKQKKTKTAVAGVNMPVFTEAQAQAAATDETAASEDVKDE